MNGKVCLITGATAGIGKCAAMELAARGARVVMISRDSSRGESARVEIADVASGRPVDLLIGDLSSQAEIRRLVEEFKSRYDRLDVLVNNAGALFSKREVTVDRIEATLATNHLAYFLLAGLMLPLLKKSAPARIVNVASDAHRWGHLDFDDLQGSKKYSGWGAYCNSKLANIMFTYEMARRLEGSGVTVNCLHPGAVRTSLFRDFSGVTGALVKLASPFLRSPQKGAETIVYLASSPEVEGVSGRYFKDCKPINSSDESMDRSAWKRLWEISETLTHSSEGAVTGK